MEKVKIHYLRLLNYLNFLSLACVFAVACALVSPVLPRVDYYQSLTFLFFFFF